MSDCKCGKEGCLGSENCKCGENCACNSIDIKILDFEHDKTREAVTATIAEAASPPTCYYSRSCTCGRPDCPGVSKVAVWKY